MRDTPPSIQDGKYGYEPAAVSNFERDTTVPGILDAATAQRLGRACYDASTSWINSGRRLKWSDSLRAFQSLHPSGSKYLSTDYRYRTTLYRPKTRTMVRRDEAQTAAAFFANEDVVSITPQDDDDPKQLASATLMKELLQYRLTHTIPWFLTLVGARQDAEVMGVAIGKAYWQFEEMLLGHDEVPVLDPRTQMPMVGEDMQPMTRLEPRRKTLKDRPWADLIAPENFRFEPGADWRNPIQTSPYIIELIPMYLSDIRKKIDSGEWKDVAESAIQGSADLDDDTTRRSREQGRIPGKDDDAWKPRDYAIGWVRENVVRFGQKDWHFYSLSSAGELLTDPVPIEEVYFHGERPWVCGYITVEAHKTYPSSKVELTRDLQWMANDDMNLRFDNVKLGLNPRQFVRNGSGMDPQDVRVFFPGKVIMTSDPTKDILWDRPPVNTTDAFAEQDRIDLDFDGLTGSFSNSSVQASQLTQQSATGMHLMSGEASGMNEYELRVFAETWVEPMLRLLIKLEQRYETDPVVLAIAGKNAQLIQKFGIDQITDDLLDQELTTKVNVGIGSTNPQLKLRNFVAGADILGKIFGPAAAMGANFKEVAKEIFGMLGYKDGERFFNPDFDPRVAMLQQQLQQLQSKQKAPAQGAPPDPTKVQAAQITAQGKVQERQLQAQNDARSDAMDLRRMQVEQEAELRRTAMQEQANMERIRMQEQAENWRTMMGIRRDMAGEHFEHARFHAGLAHQSQMAKMKPAAGARAR